MKPQKIILTILATILFFSNYSFCEFDTFSQEDDFIKIPEYTIEAPFENEEKEEQMITYPEVEKSTEEKEQENLDQNNKDDQFASSNTIKMAAGVTILGILILATLKLKDCT